MKYKVVPFVPSIKPNKENATHVAQQFESVIRDHVSDGWEYLRLESVSTYVKPDSGCFGIGGSPGYTKTSQMIVFRQVL